MFSSERALQISKLLQKCSGHYASLQLCSARSTALQTKNSRRSASTTIQSSQKYDDSRAPNYQLLPRKCSGHYSSLSAMFSPLHSVTQRYKQRTVLESSLQSVCSPWKIQTIPVYKHTVGKPCIVLPRIDTLGCQQKEMGHKGGQR